MIGQSGNLNLGDPRTDAVEQLLNLDTGFVDSGAVR